MIGKLLWCRTRALSIVLVFLILNTVVPASADTSASDADDDDRGALPLAVTQPWTGDLDGMTERRMIRILVTYSKTHYFVDRGRQLGLSYEAGKLFEDKLNKD